MAARGAWARLTEVTRKARRVVSSTNGGTPYGASWRSRFAGTFVRSSSSLIIPPLRRDEGSCETLLSAAIRPRPTPRRRRLSEGNVHARAGGIERDCAPDAAARARDKGRSCRRRRSARQAVTGCAALLFAGACTIPVIGL